MNDQNIAYRLKFLIDNLGISNSQFADECNISRPTLSQLITGRNKKISDVIIGQIHAAYPHLSILWLLFGEGEMWHNNEETKATGESLADKPKCEQEEASDDSEHSTNNPNGKFSSDQLKSLSDIPKNTHKDGASQDYPKENGLNQDQQRAKSSINKDVIDYLESSGFLNEITKPAPKTRKVVHVTIYYDDSTFETFYPQG